MNPYEVLGVAPGATPAEIKSAFRKLAKEHHPDRHGGSDDAKAKFQEIQAAYDMLRNDKPRQQHERAQQHQPFGPGGFSFHFGGGDPSQMFEEMFRRYQAAEHTTTYQAYIEITLEEAMRGGETEIRLPNGEAIKVAIPVGIHHGQGFTIRDAVQETPVPGGQSMPKGHLQVVVRIRPHQTFAREGDNLLTKVDVDILDAILGCEKEISTLAGERIRIKLAPNTKPNTIITVTGHGMPILNGGGGRGNLLAHVLIVFREFSEEERKILEQLR